MTGSAWTCLPSGADWRGQSQKHLPAVMATSRSDRFTALVAARAGAVFAAPAPLPALAIIVLQAGGLFPHPPRRHGPTTVSLRVGRTIVPRPAFSLPACR